MKEKFNLADHRRALAMNADAYTYELQDENIERLIP